MAKTILVVEDDYLNMKLFCDLIEAHGYRTILARNGKEALDAVSAHDLDLIILDIQLPDISGLEVTRRIKKDSTTKSIPIVAVTAFATAGDSERIRSAGCDEYLTKPVSVDRLMSAVKRFLG